MSEPQPHTSDRSPGPLIGCVLDPLLVIVVPLLLSYYRYDVFWVLLSVGIWAAVAMQYSQVAVHWMAQDAQKGKASRFRIIRIIFFHSLFWYAVPLVVRIVASKM